MAKRPDTWAADKIHDLVLEKKELQRRLKDAEARLAEVKGRSYTAFFYEVCARAERAMLTSHKLEGMHFMAMKQVKGEWDAAIEAGEGG